MADESPPKILVSSVDGSILYQKLCSDCHGTFGQQGSRSSNLLQPPPPNLFTGTLSHGDSTAELAASIRQGWGQNMLSYRFRLTESQIEALANYIRNNREQKNVDNEGTR